MLGYNLSNFEDFLCFSVKIRSKIQQTDVVFHFFKIVEMLKKRVGILIDKKIIFGTFLKVPDKQKFVNQKIRHFNKLFGDFRTIW